MRLNLSDVRIEYDTDHMVWILKLILEDRVVNAVSYTFEDAWRRLADEIRG